MKSFLKELGTLHAKSLSGKQDSSSKEVEKRLANIEKRLHELKNEAQHAEPILYQIIIELQNLRILSNFKAVISEDKLASELQDMGLSMRAAKKVATRLAPKLTVGINRLIREGKE